MVARKLAFFGIAVFLLAFPALGLLWIWNDGHTKVRLSAIAASNRMLPEIVGASRAEDLDSFGTLEFRESGGAGKFLSARKPWGKVLSVGASRAVESDSGSRGDHVWHFVTLVSDVEFEQGTARVRFKLARETMAPDWRLESIAISKNSS